jgi:hypothetical protein
MTTTTTSDLDDPLLCEADTAAVFDSFAHGTPLDPAVGERVRARAARITEHIRQTHGVIDDETFQRLIDEDE